MPRAKEVHHIIATSKIPTVLVMQDELGIKATNVNPEHLSQSSEPLGKDPRRQASWKDDKIRRLLRPEQGTILSIHSADTVYLHNGVDEMHKPGNEYGRLPFGMSVPNDADTHERYIQEAQELYGIPFTGVWANAYINHIVHKRNRIAALEIEVDFPESIHPDRVRDIYNPNVNTRVLLAEEAAERRLPFYVSNAGRGERTPISSDLALQLIVHRVLAKDWYDQLQSSKPDSIYRDEFGRRGQVAIDFKREVKRD
ncbi:hypothetical protein KBD71_03560 [Candidatus Woesebacteria bacterium]|nr:hypothetical protein [Candidatus Woesebacteria bacterium]